MRYLIGHFKGKPARMAAIYGFPEGTKETLPAVMHIHGGGQRAFLHEVKFLVGRGYAAMSVNWGGSGTGKAPFNSCEKSEPGDPNTDRGDVDVFRKTCLFLRLPNRQCNASASLDAEGDGSLVARAGGIEVTDHAQDGPEEQHKRRASSKRMAGISRPAPDVCMHEGNRGRARRPGIYIGARGFRIGRGPANELGGD